MKLKHIKQLAGAGLLAVILSACGGGNCDTSGGQQQQTVSNTLLSISAPSSMVAGSALDVPLVITNNSTHDLTNISYAVTAGSNTTGGAITFNNVCSNINAGATCAIMTAHVTAPNHPGVFGVTATSAGVSNGLNSASVTQKVSTLFSRVEAALSLQSSFTITANVVIGLANIPSNIGSGVDGLSIFFNPTYAYSPTAPNYAIVSVVVSSNNAAGLFNTINLVNAAGAPIDGVIPLTGNSGNGLTNLGYGSVVSLVVPITSGSTGIAFYVQASQVDVSGNVANLQTGSMPNVINFFDKSVVKKGILDIQPSYLDLNNSYTSQVVTFTNSGNGPVTGLSGTFSSPFETSNSTCGTTLEPGASCSYTVSYNPNTTVNGSGSAIFNYNDGSGSSSSSAVINYQGNIQSGGLLINSANSTFDFAATTNNQSKSSLVTFTNTGNTIESGFVFTLPANFTITPGATNGCATPLLLQPSESCNINLVYTAPSNQPSPVVNTSATISYTYNNGLKTSTNILPIGYTTIQSSATLAAPTSNVLFSANLPDNNSESTISVITITNNGDNPATAINPTILGDNSSLFSIDSNACSGTIAPGASCDITVKFGPVPTGTSVGTKNATLNLGYTAYGNTTQTTVIGLSGQVHGQQSAIVPNTLPSPAATGFSNGTGSSATPYMVEQNTTPPPKLTYTLTNSGAVAANNFYLSNSNLGGWSIMNSTCGTLGSPIVLAPSSSCTFEVWLNPSATGAANLNLANISSHWTDEDSPTGQSQSLSGTIYASIYQQLSVTAVLSSSESGLPTITSTPSGSTFYVVFTLSGGLNVPSSSYSVSVPSFPASGSCSLSSATTNCAVAITAPGAGSTGNTLNLSGSTIPVPSTLGINVLAPFQWSLPGESSAALDTLSGQVRSITIDPANNVYAGGYDSNGFGAVWKWNGSAWSTVGNSAISGSNYIYSVTYESNSSTLYAGGLDGSNLGAVWKWNGSVWSELGSAAITNSYYVYAMTTDESGNLYAGGQNSSNQGTVWKWNGSAWSIIGSSAVGDSTEIDAVARDVSGNIYAGGYITGGSGAGAVWMWNGSAWSKLGNANIANCAQINSVVVDASGNVYASGADIFGVGVVWMWNGSAWSLVGGTNPTGSTTIFSLAFDSNGVLFAGGQGPQIGVGNYYHPGGVWSLVGGSWNLVGGNYITASGVIASEVQSIAFDSTGKLYTGGQSDSNNGGDVFMGIQ